MFRNADFNLKLLTEFNPSLVTCFDPERAPTHTDNDAHKLDFMINITNQYEDMLAGYLYAQSVIMPGIRKNGIEAVTASDLMTWLNGIHARIAAQLASIFNTRAGEFTRKGIVRWQFSIPTGLALSAYCIGRLSASKTLEFLLESGVKRTLAESILTIVNKLLQQAHAQNLLKILTKPENDPSVSGDIASNILGDCIDYNQLSSSEIADIKQFVKFTRPPEEMAAAMQVYAAELLRRWKNTRAENIDDVCALLYFAFYELTEIHPYFNGNGRTATCLMNIILRSFDLPSILLRELHERDDPSSPYSRMVESLASNNPDPALFAQLIKFRLEKIKQNGAYRNAMLDELIPVRVKIARIRSKIATLSSVAKEHESYLAVFNNNIIAIRAFADRHGGGYSDAISLEFNKLCLPQFEAALRELENKAAQSNVVRFNPTAKTYTAQEKEALADALASISSHDQWKIYVKNGALVALGTVATDEQGNALIAKLEQVGACDAVLQRVASDKSLVVYASNMKMTVLQSAQQPAATLAVGKP